MEFRNETYFFDHHPLDGRRRPLTPQEELEAIAKSLAFHGEIVKAAATVQEFSDRVRSMAFHDPSVAVDRGLAVGTVDELTRLLHALHVEVDLPKLRDAAQSLVR